MFSLEMLMEVVMVVGIVVIRYQIGNRNTWNKQKQLVVLFQFTIIKRFILLLKFWNFYNTWII